MWGFGCRWESRSSAGRDPYVGVYLYGPDFEKLEDMMGEVERRLQPDSIGDEFAKRSGVWERRDSHSRESRTGEKARYSSRADQPHAGISTGAVRLCRGFRRMITR